MQKQLQAPNILEVSDLKQFGSATGPCLSLYFEDKDPGRKTNEDRRRLKQAVDGAVAKLKAIGFDQAAIKELVDPVLALTDDDSQFEMEGNAFAIFRSPDVYRVYRPMAHMAEGTYVGEHFFIRPVLTMMDAQRHFYVLAISQNNMRVLKCTDHSSEEVSLPGDVNTSLEQWLNSRSPNHSGADAVKQTGAEGPQGSFTSQTDRDKKDEHLRNFFRQFDQGLFNVLRDENAPLILAGVDNEVTEYRGISKYQHVAEEAVNGAPDSLKGGELHSRALKCAQQHFHKPVKKALEVYNRAGNNGRADDVLSCAKAAFEGRVMQLLMRQDAVEHGIFNPDTVHAEFTDGKTGEDLINFAALQTLLHGGEVYSLDETEMPEAHPVIGILRF